MLRNHFLSVWRSLKKSPVFTVVNILGLSVGIAAFILIAVFVRDEITFDRFHQNHDRIYRVLTVNKEGNPQPFPTAMMDLIPLSVPEVERIARVQVLGETLMDYEGSKVFEKEVYGVDGDFFKIFDFSLKYGNESEALVAENSVVISRYMALKYFGEEDVVGKHFQMADNNREGIITGVLNDIPQNSRFQFNIIVPIRNINSGGFKWAGQGELYALMKNPVDEQEFESRLLDISVQNGFENKFDLKFKAENFSKIYLESEFSQTASGVKGNKDFVYIFSIIGLFLLLLAVVNYINSATAKSLAAVKQIGIKKIIGASKAYLSFQLFLETMVLVIVSVVIAAAIAEYFLPTLNTLSDKNLGLNYFSDGFILSFLILLIPLVTLLAGLYPSILLSRPKVLPLIKGENSIGRGALRRYLVVFQFSITLTLLFGTQLVKKQIDFFLKEDIGLDSSGIITTHIARGVPYSLIKSTFENIPGVQAVTSSPFPSNGTVKMPLQWTLNNENKIDGVAYQEVDDNALKVLDVHLIGGRNFIEGSQEDELGAILINEAMIEVLGFENPIGEKVKLLSPNYKMVEYNIIGITENLRFNLKQEANPAVIMQAKGRVSSVNVKLNEDVKAQTIPLLSKAWDKISPNTPFVYSVMADEIEANYEKEQKFGLVVQVFTWIAMLIAGLGLFSLSAFIILQKYKEIGVRKVLGATVLGLCLRFLRYYFGLVGVSSIIAIPIAYYLLNSWLANFAYRISIGVDAFLIGISVSMLLVVFSVGYQSVKAAIANPVDTLRTE